MPQEKLSQAPLTSPSEAAVPEKTIPAQTDGGSPWNQDFMTMFGFATDKKPDMSILGTQESPRTTEGANPMLSYFQQSWDAFKPIVTASAPAPAAPTRKRGTPPSTGSDFNSVFERLVHTESRGRHRTKSGEMTTSPVGAKGITQVMPKTGVDPGYGVTPLRNDSEEEYIRFGKDLLSAYVKNFGGDVEKGVAAYNAGPGRIEQAIKKHGDNWKNNIPQETKDYIKKVIGNAR